MAYRANPIPPEDQVEVPEDCNDVELLLGWVQEHPNAFDNSHPKHLTRIRFEGLVDRLRVKKDAAMLRQGWIMHREPFGLRTFLPPGGDQG